MVDNLPFMVRYQIKRLWCGKCGRYTGGLPCMECIRRYLEQPEVNNADSERRNQDRR